MTSPVGLIRFVNKSWLLSTNVPEQLALENLERRLGQSQAVPLGNSCLRLQIRLAKLGPVDGFFLSHLSQELFMSIELYELAAQADEHVFSPYCWRIRLALHHKNLPFVSKPWRMTEKSKIAFADTERVPVLVDGERVLSDSWAILRYLEEQYPEPSLEFHRGEVRFFRHWTEMVLFPGMSRIIVDEIHKTVHEQDREYFRETREKIFGMPLEEFTADKESKREEFRKLLKPLRATLQDFQFLGGSQPNLSDYLVFSGLMWARCTSPMPLLDPTDPVYDWRERMLDLFDGMARSCPCRELT